MNSLMFIECVEECVEVELMWLEMEANEHMSFGTIVMWIEKVGSIVVWIEKVGCVILWTVDYVVMCYFLSPEVNQIIG
jgi:hypothetical protein